MGEFAHAVTGVYHLPVEITPCFRSFFTSGLFHRNGVIRYHVLRIPDAIFPAGENASLIGKQLCNFVQILLCHLFRRTFGRCFLLLGPPQLEVIQAIRKGIGV